MTSSIQNSRILLLSLMLIFGFIQLNAQVTNILSGEVSYISGQNIYVKFSSTQGIENGDTLFIQQNSALIPTLLVTHHSSISCLCNPIGDLTFKVGDKIIGRIQSPEHTILTPTQEQTTIDEDLNEQVLKTTIPEQTRPELKSKVTGRLALSSYSNFSNATDIDYHRFRYTFSMQSQNISNSKLSAETYISFSHKLNEWDVVQENLNNALKIYSLALQYDFNKNTSLWAGRKINPRIANVGAVDGLQFQKSWNDFYAGAVVGTRPDYMDYGFNPDLLEYGAYIGHNTKSGNGFAQSSLAFFEQRNNGNTDRRFVYFQHSNTLLKNVSFFSSFELDLYALENGEAQNTLSLTGLYLSLRYRVSRQLSLFGSYDNRKNVIYYETFRNYTDEILQQASRQGFRGRITFRPVKYLNLGVDGGTRFREGDARHTNTLRGYTTYTRVPGIEASLTLSANLMQTSYLDGQVYGARLSKDLFQGKLFTMLNYRMVNFNYVNTSSKLKQHISEIDLSYRFNKKLYVSVNFEATFQEENMYNRLYLTLRRKF
ncbi:hypothetical protein OU798_12030 [Prolixibacteraceae bacterium Z1-6]|uniref:Uncharacterized protein n=1 Tax=Draconibacterium aestuarii TaxID=2998507 RepID=A0A9X3F925_9BACT|nr:hypothetical protein [Prolixibacteraceae bacterium Z1-6]